MKALRIELSEAEVILLLKRGRVHLNEVMNITTENQPPVYLKVYDHRK